MSLLPFVLSPGGTGTDGPVPAAGAGGWTFHCVPVAFRCIGMTGRRASARWTGR